MPGQHYNHTHFWKWMKPGGGGDKIPGNLEKKIVADLGSVAKMKEDFIQAGVTQFGSGWCWLAVKDGKVAVTKTANGESPLVQGGKPILGCDVWEHSYYVDYRKPAAGLPQGVRRPSRQLGLCRGAARGGNEISVAMPRRGWRPRMVKKLKLPQRQAISQASCAWANARRS